MSQGTRARMTSEPFISFIALTIVQSDKNQGGKMRTRLPLVK